MDASSNVKSPVVCLDVPDDPEAGRRLLKGISEIVAIINLPRLDYHRRMEKILTVILNYLGVEQGSIMALDKRKYLKVIAASKPELVGLRQSLADKSVASWVVSNKSPLFLPDISQDSRFEQRSAKYRKKSLLSSPIFSGDKVVGVINVADKSGTADFFKEDISFLLGFSSVILLQMLNQNLHEEITNQRNTLRKRNLELKRQEKSRAEFSKLLVHDLKAPLSEVVANLDILSYSIQKSNAEFLEGAQIGCERAVLMIGNLAGIDKIEDDKFTIIKEETSPLNLLKESISSLKGLAKIKDVTLCLKDPAAELPKIKLDRTLILRVLQNLITNALRHSPAGSTITLGCRREPQKKYLTFLVNDQGSGIPADKQKFLFEKYAKITPGEDHLIGSGLGLYFCRLAVGTHRGSLWVESTVGKGSTFFFSLPL